MVYSQFTCSGVTSKICRGLLSCTCTPMSHSWWRRGGLVLTNTSAASQCSWPVVRVRWRCWDWRWRGLVTDGSWDGCEGGDNDCGWVRGSSVSPLCWRSPLWSWIRPRRCRRAAGSAGAAGWRWSGGSSPVYPRRRGSCNSQKGLRYAARRCQTPVRNKSNVFKRKRRTQEFKHSVLDSDTLMFTL